MLKEIGSWKEWCILGQMYRLPTIPNHMADAQAPWVLPSFSFAHWSICAPKWEDLRTRTDQKWLGSRDRVKAL